LVGDKLVIDGAMRRAWWWMLVLLILFSVAVDGVTTISTPNQPYERIKGTVTFASVLASTSQ